jgi:hypothetical protein
LQYINFKDALPVPKKEQLPLSILIVVLGIGVLLVVIASVTLGVLQAQLSDQITDQLLQKNRVEAELKEEQASARQEQEQQRLEASIEQLTLQISEEKLLLELIENTTSSPLSIGFAPYLDGLARQINSQLWLEEITLENGGEEIALIGQAQRPEAVLHYLQKLGDEAAFRGHQFRVFHITQNQQSPELLHFVIRTKEKISERDLE